jgi:ribonucleotide monophosphatase NagD (HAD superfamily)
MVGDQLETDIRGANACGIDAVLVNTGVSAADLGHVNAALRPTYWMRSVAPPGYVAGASRSAERANQQDPTDK